MTQIRKSVVLILDGAAGWPHEALGGLTTLEAARTPNLDAITPEGILGLVRTVPESMEPSSAIACMSVLGFEPERYYAGRGPIEALAMGIDLKPGQAALRCNLVAVTDGVMKSYNAGHIHPDQASLLLQTLREHLETPRLRLHPGVGFRSILTVDDGADVVATECAPAHDIADKPVAAHLPKGPGSALLVDLMDRSEEILRDHPVNLARVVKGEFPATQVWPFWPGMRAEGMPSFESRFGLRAGITSAVDLLRGLGRQVGLHFLDIPGVTDGDDNDFEGQMRGALAALEDLDMVVVHVEAPDEAGHAGSAEAKVRAVEQIDLLMISQLRERGDVRLLALPDHPTPLALKTHVADPVPYLMWGPGCGTNGASRFTERAAAATGVTVDPGWELMRRFTRCGEGSRS